MGQKKRDKRLIEDAPDSWLNELENEIIPNVLTKEERKSYSKQARQLRGAIERRLARQKPPAVSTEPFVVPGQEPM